MKQRTNNDCMVCCLAMMTGLTYEQVLGSLPVKGSVPTPDAAVFLWENGFDVISKTPDDIDWDKDAILCMPSLNYPGKFHAVFYTPREILDPSNDKTYDILSVQGLIEFALQVD